MRVGKVVAAAVVFLACGWTPAGADPMGWQQPGGAGSPVYLTYSYSNLLTPGFNTTLTPGELRSSVELAFGVWARYAPIHFLEAPNSGPDPSESEYDANGTPDIRMGYQPHLVGGEAAHAHLPFERGSGARSGIAGDIHFSNDTGAFGTSVWGHALDGPLTLDFFSAMLHETGHALGLFHLYGVPAIMAGNLFHVFLDPSQAQLFPADIAALQRIYGAGAGSVQPLPDVVATPEPATVLLVTAGAALAGLRRRARSRRR
jgi:hypothetical protein